MRKDYLFHILRAILREEDVTFKDEELFRVLLSCPSYPNAQSLVSTLSYWGIKAEIYRSDYTSLRESDTIRLIHTEEKGGHFYRFYPKGDFVILYDGKRKKMSVDGFLSLWDGIVMIVEKRAKGKNKARRIYSNTNILVPIVLIVELFKANIMQLALLHLYHTDRIRFLYSLEYGIERSKVDGMGITEDTVASYRDQLSRIHDLHLTHLPLIILNGHILSSDFEVADIKYLIHSEIPFHK